jgi:hypothetical protein
MRNYGYDGISVRWDKFNYDNKSGQAIRGVKLDEWYQDFIRSLLAARGAVIRNGKAVLLDGLSMKKDQYFFTVDELIKKLKRLPDVHQTTN